MNNYTDSRLAHYLEAIAGSFNEKIIDTAHVTTINSICAFLPASVSSIFGFEIRLADQERQTDFALCLDNSPINMKHVCRILTDQNDVFQGPGWDRIRNCDTTWRMNTGSAVESLCLEFDIEPDEKTIPQPSAFFSNLRYPTYSLSASEKAEKEYKKIIPFLSTLIDLDSITKNNIYECIKALPAGNSIVYWTGVMTRRNTAGVRLCISKLGSVGLKTYLHSIGLAKELDSIITLVNEWNFIDHEFFLNIDVSDHVGDRICFEILFSEPKVPEVVPRWKPFLDYIVEKKLCCPEKAKALLEYPGYDIDDGKRAWPENLRAASTLFRFSKRSAFIRKLSHIKIEYTKGVLKAKAYLEIRLAWINQKNKNK